MSARDCPECGSSDTSREFLDEGRGEIVDCRTCDSCRCYFTVAFAEPIVTVEKHGNQHGGEGER